MGRHAVLEHNYFATGVCLDAILSRALANYAFDLKKLMSKIFQDYVTPIVLISVDLQLQETHRLAICQWHICTKLESLNSCIPPKQTNNDVTFILY